MRTRTLVLTALAVVGTIALVECSDARPSSTAPEHTPAGALFSGRPIERVPIAEVTQYASTLRFNVQAPSADEAMIRDSRGETIRLRAEPVADASDISDRERIAGRVIARLISTAAYAPLGLAAGVNFYWVDGAGDGARAVIIPADGSARTVRPLILRQHAFGNVTTPTVRFLHVPGMEPGIPLINGRCGPTCCGFTVPGIAPGDMPRIDQALVQMHERIAAGL